MTPEAILRTECGRHRGFVATSVAETTLEPKGLLTRLKKIPGKITAYFQRELIAEVWKSNHVPRPENNYYIIRATDGTLFHVEY